jgi:hypothetical protein
MFGAKKLPKIEQLDPFDALLLAITLPGDRDVTLYRAKSGGGFFSSMGFMRSGHLPVAWSCKPKHASGSEGSVSSFILSALNLANRQVVKKGTGAKDSFSLRHLTPFVLIGETEMMGERSPILSGSTKTKSLIRIFSSFY